MHTDIGRDLLKRVTEELAEIAKPEAQPQMEGRMLTMIFAPDRHAIERIKRTEAEQASASEPAAEEVSEADADEAKKEERGRKASPGRARRGEETLEDEAQALMEEIDRA